LALEIIFRITLHYRAVILTNLCYAVSLIGMTYVFIPAFGLLGVGVAWAIANLVAIIVGGLFVKRRGLTAFG
jgi:O-antigen/teichoic acid export membrane protein